MTDPRIDLKSPWIAGLLAFLIPGAGHLYQGRVFKGLLYLVCILGTFAYGLALGEGQAVYRPLRVSTKNYYGYWAQFLVGLPALPPLVQSRRYEPPEMQFAAEDPEKRGVLDAPISSATFNGRISLTDSEGRRIAGSATGRVTLETVREGGREVSGAFKGTLDDGTEIDVRLGSPILVGPRVFAAEDVSYRRLGEDGSELRERGPAEFSPRRRYLSATVFDPVADRRAGSLEGTFPRGFWDWYGVPPTDEALDDLNRRLGKVFDLALVCTWIAGLLNLLAIWDAVEGPAYGYGDEKSEADEPEAAPAKSTPAAAKPSPGASA